VHVEGLRQTREPPADFAQAYDDERLAAKLVFAACLRAANRHWRPVEIVLERSTDLSEPWRLAMAATIVECEGRTLYVRIGDEVRPLDSADICALRLPPGPGTPTVAPESWFRFDRRTCRVTVTLQGIQPPIWRRLEVSASTTLARLHEVLQAAMGWTNSHLHMFEIGDERIAIPYDLDQLMEGDISRSGRLVNLGDVVDHGVRRFTYEYDFGDSWLHTIEIEEVRAARGGEDRPRCVDGARACPPEDCGGPNGYARLLEILFDPHHPEFEEMRAWAGRLEPERFNLPSVNAAVAAVTVY
jgi:hypothetical protein